MLLFLALFIIIWFEFFFCTLFCLLCKKAISFGSPTLKSLSCYRAFVDLSCTFVCCHLQLVPVSCSHQTIYTYITCKLISFEYVKCITILYLLCYDHTMFTHAYLPVISYITIILCCSVIYISLSHCKFPLD